MSVIGKCQEFKPETERFSIYVERLKLYFDANRVSEDKKVAVFLTVIGPKTYALLSDLYTPTKPRDIALEDLITTLAGHFEPVRIVDFVAELRRLATNCKFGTHLEEALRDRFVCGLNNEATQKRLLIENDLTLRALSLFFQILPISNTGDSIAYNLATVHFLYPKLGSFSDMEYYFHQLAYRDLKVPKRIVGSN